MMTPAQREVAIKQMQDLSNGFYVAARAIGVHPFLEVTGLMNEYIKACQAAHEKGIDFSECNVHSGQHLPLEPFMVDYINEKLDCMFTGRIKLRRNTEGSGAHG